MWLISETLPKEPARSQALGWLHTLVENGYPLWQDRKQSVEPADGDLLTVKMETEAHVFANFCLARAIASDGQLDLASVSSHWSQPAVGKLYRELASCGFTKSSECCVQYFSWMSGLSNGTPLFGDDFRTDWSFYTLFINSDLATMIPVFQAAADFQRTLPEGIPDEYARTMVACLSDGSKQFTQDLVNWFGQIQQAGQDAFILWW
ncbi:MAG: hypothetical protein WCJ09_26515 [Planctomycetota bacterium]